MMVAQKRSYALNEEWPMSEGVLELIRTRAVCMKRGDTFPGGGSLKKAIDRDKGRTGIDALAVMERVLAERPDLADGAFDYLPDADYMALRSWVRGLCEEVKAEGEA